MTNIQAIRGVNVTHQHRRRKEKYKELKAQRKNEFYFEET
jgi:hypothetical protein